MNANDPNVALLEVVAEKLGDELRAEMTFVGGAVVGLLINDPAMPAIRPTEDVDMICEALILADYHRVEQKLQARGFTQDMQPEAPIYRWRAGPVAVDVMPTLATKLEAFAGRGKSDFLFSHDLGDLLAVIDGRDGLVDECLSAARVGQHLPSPRPDRVL